MRPNFWRAPPALSSFFSLRRVASCLRFRFRVARCPPRQCISAPPVRGCLGLSAESRKYFFARNCTFFKMPGFSQEIARLEQFLAISRAGFRNKISRDHALRRSFAGESARLTPIHRKICSDSGQIRRRESGFGRKGIANCGIKGAQPALFWRAIPYRAPRAEGASFCQSLPGLTRLNSSSRIAAR